MPFKVTIGLVVLCGIVVGAGSGCATMFTGSTQQLTVSSQPPGARVIVNGSYSGVTPVALLLKTEHDYGIILQREGYRDTAVPVYREFNPVAILNLVSLICWVVDVATGALWRLTPGAVYVTLQPIGAGPPGYPVPSVDPWNAPAPGYAPPPGYPGAPPPELPAPPPTTNPPAPPPSSGTI
jgi:hypothetical protein